MKITSFPDSNSALASDLQIDSGALDRQTRNAQHETQASQSSYEQSSLLPQQTYAQDGTAANYTTSGTVVSQSDDSTTPSAQNPYGDVPQTVSIGHSRSDIEALTPAQVAALTNAQVHGLTNAQIPVLSSAQIQALSQREIWDLSPEQLVVLPVHGTLGSACEAWLRAA